MKRKIKKVCLLLSRLINFKRTSRGWNHELKLLLSFFHYQKERKNTSSLHQTKICFPTTFIHVLELLDIYTEQIYSFLFPTNPVMNCWQWTNFSWDLPVPSLFSPLFLWTHFCWHLLWSVKTATEQRASGVVWSVQSSMRWSPALFWTLSSY